MQNNTSQVKFENVPMLNLGHDGSVTSKDGYSVEPPARPRDIGIPQEEFEKQVLELVGQKVELQKVLSAIDQHPEISDKGTAKNMAEAIYKIANT